LVGPLSGRRGLECAFEYRSARSLYRVPEVTCFTSAFVNEVAGASCEDFDCHGNHPATSEAYALLYFNGSYLAQRLP
jgi:hypothetical protein